MCVCKERDLKIYRKHFQNVYEAAYFTNLAINLPKNASRYLKIKWIMAVMTQILYTLVRGFSVEALLVFGAE